MKKMSMMILLTSVVLTVSAKVHKFSPEFQLHTRVVEAQTLNLAGIIGAAVYGAQHVKPARGKAK